MDTNNIGINILGAPSIPGLSFRAFRGEVDFPIILDLINACKSVDQDERTDNLSDVQRNYSHLVNCDPYLDIIFAEINGQPVGYCRLYWYQVSSDNSRIYTGVGYLHPACRNQGIGHAIMRWGENRLHRISENHPQDGERYIECFTSGTETGKIAILEEFGYTPQRHFFIMVRPDLENIPAAPLPAGITVLPVKPQHYRAIWDAMQEAFTDHWGFSPATEEDYHNWQESPLFQPDLWQIAWAGDQVVGTVLAFVDSSANREYHRLRGWTEEICVRRPWRKQGIAKALICLSLRDQSSVACPKLHWAWTPKT